MSIRKLFDYSTPLVAASTVLVIGGIAIALIGAYVARDVMMSRDTIEVTGSAKRMVTADTARWRIAIETRTGVSDQQSGYERIDAATDKIVAYLNAEGFADIETPAITSNQNYTYPQYGEAIFTGYSIYRTISVRGSDVAKLQELTNSIAPLGGDGYTVASQGLELTYSKLPEMRIALLREAIKDATARAAAIASESGRDVGALREATGGVVQVLPVGGVDISDTGYYDTESLNKEVMVTVRASFEL
jgi:hypothetical protein